MRTDAGQAVVGSSPPCASGGAGAPAGAPLVTYPISQKTSYRRPSSFEVYPRSNRVKRPFTGPLPPLTDRTSSGIQGFSKHSRTRLCFAAANCSDLIRSQFCLTYHDYWPINGKEYKRQLNLFLTRARQAFPFLAYLWVSEYQTRGCPHVHFYSDLPANEENRRILAGIWHKIADPTNEEHRWFHADRPDAMTPWDMGTGSYLCKYLDKSHQKAIPEGFHSFGRWWGNSRGLVPSPEVITAEEVEALFPRVNEDTGETGDLDPVAFLVRTVGRHHEKLSRRSWFRHSNKSTLSLTGAEVFRQALAYLQKTQGRDDSPPPPF